MRLKYCLDCQRNITPGKSFSWIGFLFGFGIFYLLYYWFLKSKRCPICNGTSFEDAHPRYVQELGPWDENPGEYDAPAPSKH